MLAQPSPLTISTEIEYVPVINGGHLPAAGLADDNEDDAVRSFSR